MKKHSEIAQYIIKKALEDYDNKFILMDFAKFLGLNINKIEKHIKKREFKAGKALTKDELMKETNDVLNLII